MEDLDWRRRAQLIDKLACYVILPTGLRSRRLLVRIQSGILTCGERFAASSRCGPGPMPALAQGDGGQHSADQPGPGPGRRVEKANRNGQSPAADDVAVRV